MGMGGGATADKGTGGLNRSTNMGSIGMGSGAPGATSGMAGGGYGKNGGSYANGLGVTTPKSYTQPAGGGWSNSGPVMGGSGNMAAGGPYSPGWGRVDLGGWSYGRPNPNQTAHGGRRPGGLLSGPDDAITTAPIPPIAQPIQSPWSFMDQIQQLRNRMRALNTGQYYSGGQWQGGGQMNTMDNPGYGGIGLSTPNGVNRIGKGDPLGNGRGGGFGG